MRVDHSDLPITLRLILLLLVVWFLPDTWHSYWPLSDTATLLIISTNSDQSSPTIALIRLSRELLRLLRAISCGIGVVWRSQDTYQATIQNTVQVFICLGGCQYTTIPTPTNPSITIIAFLRSVCKNLTRQ